MKRTILAALMASLLMCVTMVSAQAPRHGHGAAPKSTEEIAKNRTERLTERLGLNATQVEEVYAVQLQRAERMKEVRAKGNIAPEERRVCMKEARQHEDVSMKRILTDEQYADWKKMEAERTQHGGRSKGGKKGNPNKNKE